jgi:hypothetical protein
MIETWLPIPGYEGRYDVSDEGRVRSWLTNRGRDVPRILAQAVHPDGYYQVALHKDGKQRTVKVHKLVMLAFVGPLPPGMETRHMDGDSRNNRRANLRYGTPTENAGDRVRHGTATRWMAHRTHCKNGHELTGANVSSSPSAHGRRRCLACGRERERTYRERRAS